MGIRDPYPGTRPSATNSPYSGNVVAGRGAIDLRQEMEDIFYGTSTEVPQSHWVILRQVDLSSRSDNFEGGQWDEPVGGPIWDYTDIAVLTRHNSVTSGSLARFLEQEEQMGIVHIDYRIYYFEYNVVPKKEDWIFEISWDDHTVEPIPGNLVIDDYIDRFNINDVVPLRGDHGRVEFYACLCKRDRVHE
jgi:hypothetical protein